MDRIKMELDSDDNSDEDMINMYIDPAHSGPTPIIIKQPKVEPRYTPARTNINSAKIIGNSPSTHSPAITTPTPSKTFGDRGKKGAIIFRYKCKDSGAWEDTDKRKDNEPCTIVKVGPKFNDDYKFMFQKVKDMALKMDDIITVMGTEILDKLDSSGENTATDETQLVSFYARASLDDMSVEEHRYVGRVRSEGTLTSSSVYFEGCLEHSNGHIVTLDLSGMEEYYLFPGQIVVMQGKNEMGKCLRVSQIHEPEALPFQPVSLREDHPLALNIMVAAGPFTPSDCVAFQPLEDLISVIKKDKPDFCFLIGPFLDASHTKINTMSNSGHTFEGLFCSQLIHLNKTLSESNTVTKLVLVPSYRDVNGQMVHPTPPYSFSEDQQQSIISSLKKEGFLFLLPDPATISINGIVIGLTSTDILKHLSRDELANSAISSDRMGRMVRHLLTQRSFYPLYPCDESVPFDVEHHANFGRMEVRPHILILPSDLRYFIKDVDGTIVINPERLTKGSTGGTFARIQIDLTSAAQENQTLSSISDFCIGEIIKI